MACCTYRTMVYPGSDSESKTLLTGIRRYHDVLYITGFYVATPSSIITGFVYQGNERGKGMWHEFNYPSSEGKTITATSLYGPDVTTYRNITIVGNYSTAEDGTKAFGCLYRGKITGKGVWKTLIPQSLSSQPILNTIAHSTMNDVVVGNYDTSLIQGKAFIYDIYKDIYYNIHLDDAISITAYGIWYDTHKDLYTICGGYASVKHGEVGYIVDWDRDTNTLYNHRVYHYDNDPKSKITHFDGITSDGCGGYNLTGMATTSSGEVEAFICYAPKSGKVKWRQLIYPKSTSTTGNSIADTTVIGVYTKANASGAGAFGYIKC